MLLQHIILSTTLDTNERVLAQMGKTAYAWNVSNAETIHTIEEKDDGKRLDVFLLTLAPPHLTRGDIQRAIKQGHVVVDEKEYTKAGSIVHLGQTVRIRDNAFEKVAPVVEENPDIPLHILHEDPSLLVVDKPAGIAVHAGIRNEHPTLADALLARFPGLRDVGEDPLRPGIVHRLDKDTSGVLLVARTPEMFTFLKDGFQKRLIKKEYTALVRGVVTEDDGSIKKPLIRSPRNPLRRTVAQKGEGKEAETYFQVAERFPHYTLLNVYPITGRTHQIRVHLAHLGFPVVGDQLYGKQQKDGLLPPLRRHFLHASALTLVLPSGKTRRFESPLPPDLQDIVDILTADRDGRPTKDRPVTFRPWRHSFGRGPR